MERKIVGQASLIVSMAKHIKACARELKERNHGITSFNFDWFGDNTEVRFKDKCFGINGKLSIEALTALIQKALSESGCNGVISRDGNVCNVKLFGKPIKAFKMLQWLIKKYSGFDVNWDYIRSSRNNRDTTYLCYNEEECKRGIEFIRTIRTSKDVLKTSFVYDIGNSPMEVRALKLVVETPHGKYKGDITLIG